MLVKLNSRLLRNLFEVRWEEVVVLATQFYVELRPGQTDIAALYIYIYIYIYTHTHIQIPIMNDGIIYVCIRTSIYLRVWDMASVM